MSVGQKSIYIYIYILNTIWDLPTNRMNNVTMPSGDPNEQFLTDASANKPNTNWLGTGMSFLINLKATFALHMHLNFLSRGR